MLRNLSKLCTNSIYFSRTLFDQLALKSLKPPNKVLSSVLLSQKFHTNNRVRNLMEFFDDKKNWGESEVKVGRAWQLDELRIKSNVDLHKLWYVLLKEKNMLLTMEHECNEKIRLFPNPERLDKIKISMANLETVVKERNRAYHELETGETGERPNELGINFYNAMEHVSNFVNTESLETRNYNDVKLEKKLLLLYREKLHNKKRKLKNRQRNEVMMLLKRNPNLDRNLLQQRFPDVDIPKLLRNDKTRGHYIPEIEKIK